MVKSQLSLDRTFGALADPTRRAMLARLSGGEWMSVSELARPFPMSLPAVMKHLNVLSDAGLVARVKTGRVVECQLTPGPIDAAVRWLETHRAFWSASLDRLADLVETPPPAKKRVRAAR